MMLLYRFFFQAEDGIRDVAVTGVQTCALPILRHEHGDGEPLVFMTQRFRLDAYLLEKAANAGAEVREGMKVEHAQAGSEGVERSEERRVGKECRARWSPER